MSQGSASPRRRFSLTSIAPSMLPKSSLRSSAPSQIEPRMTRSQAKIQEKRLQNAQNQVISRLPPEILLLIFTQLKQACRTISRRRTVEDMIWASATQVCHHWREVAVGSPLLWTTVNVTERNWRWVGDVLKRSRNAPLFAYVDLSHSTVDHWAFHTAQTAVLALSECVSRCRELDIRLPNHFDSRAFLVDHLFLKDPGWKLEKLSITAHHQSTRIVFSDDLLQSRSLRQLELNGGRIDWNATILRQLTHLRIAALFRDTLPLDVFLQLISSMTDLRVLDMDASPFMEFWPDAIPPPTTPSTIVELKSLEKLTFQGALEVTTAFMSCITTSPGVRVTAKTTFDVLDDIPDRFNDFLISVARHLPDRKPKSTKRFLKTARFGKALGDGFTVQAFYPILTPHDTTLIEVEDNGATLNLLVGGSDYEESEAVVLRSLFQCLPFHYLVKVNMLGFYTFGPEVWVEIFGALPVLTLLMLSTSNVASFFEGLTHGLDRLAENDSKPSDNGDGTPKIPFSALTSVTVALPTTATYADFFPNPMVPSLRKRKHFGHRLVLLTLFESSSLSPEDISTISEVVDNLISV